jgi:sulfur-carrier protein
MPLVRLTGDVAAFTGGLLEIEVVADSFGRMIAELDARYPGLGDFIDKRMAIAIDGVIHQDAWGAILAPQAEIVLLPKIGGG